MQKWKKWEPVQGIPGTLYAESLYDSKDGFVIRFRDETKSKKIIVTFEGVIFSYRWADEGSLLKTLSFLTQNYGVDFYAHWTCFKVENSDYIKWFLDESSGRYDKNEVKHFVFQTPDDVIEVLSSYDPKIEIQNIE